MVKFRGKGKFLPCDGGVVPRRWRRWPGQIQATQVFFEEGVPVGIQMAPSAGNMLEMGVGVTVGGAGDSTSLVWTMPDWWETWVDFGSFVGAHRTFAGTLQSLFAHGKGITRI